jgi:thymidylate synthase
LSNDVALGAPFNIAQYALLAHIFAKYANCSVGDLIYSIGDAHIYLNQVELIKEQLSREPRSLPTLTIPSIKYVSNWTIDDFILEGYDPHPPIVFPAAAV